jgi:hypothetical protein
LAWREQVGRREFIANAARTRPYGRRRDFGFGSWLCEGAALRDADHPGGLIEGGAFAISRNPICVAFAIILAGEFLIFPAELR